jgi:hypothetical protein
MRLGNLRLECASGIIPDCGFPVFLAKLLKVMGAALKGRGFKPRRKAPYIQQRL